MVVGGDILCNQLRGIVADDRHQKLKTTKPAAKTQGAFGTRLRLESHAAAHGNAKRIHGQADC